MSASVRPYLSVCRWITAISMLALGGCASADHRAAGTASHAAAAAPDVPTAATVATVEASYNRLRTDIERAVLQMHWAVLREAEIDAAEESPAIRLEALHINQRTVEIVAYRVGKSKTVMVDDPETFEVAVRVGRFGNPAIEAAYIAKLRDVLAGSAAPDRSRSFDLP